MEYAVIVIFCLVYLGMILGTWPGLALDRTGIALLGAIAFIEVQNVSISQVVSYVDLSALAILFSFMIISAQFYYSGFYTHVVGRIGQWKLTLYSNPF
jgi:Na+/H+ antiporter NhaD/arsenite permease-like protein